MGAALDSSGNIYVANAGSLDGGFDSVTIYPAGSNANVTPTVTIGAGGAATDNTRLNDPDAIVVGPAGHIYVANPFAGNEGNGTVTVYMPGDNGNVAPKATLSGTRHGAARSRRPRHQFLPQLACAERLRRTGSRRQRHRL